MNLIKRWFKKLFTYSLECEICGKLAPRNGKTYHEWHPSVRSHREDTGPFVEVCPDCFIGQVRLDNLGRFYIE